jgi:DNA-binding IclR family transcriptional regulator
VHVLHGGTVRLVPADRAEQTSAERKELMSTSVTRRALAVLDAFDAEHPALPLSELARRAGLPLSTAHRLVADLTAWGALERSSDGSYVVGRRLWDLGLLAPVSRQLRETALPFLQDLSAATGENAHLAVREGTSALYVERIAGRSAVRIVSRSGSRLPLHATGVGKVLLAHAEPEVVDDVLSRLRRITPFTVVDPQVLRRQLLDVRRRGWALTGEEMSLGTASVAVPVTDGSGALVAALGVVAASSRRDLPRLVPALQVAARGVARSVPAPGAAR